MAKYLVNGHYVDRETYQKHLEGERKKLADTAKKAEQEQLGSPKAAEKGGK